MNYRVVIIGSSGGGVISRAGSHDYVRRCIHEVVADRDCGLLSVANDLGLRARYLPANNGAEFSDYLHRQYGRNDDLFYLCFYTRLLRGDFLHANIGRIFNCHPSLLPSFKGLHGFEDTLESSALFMGCTIHVVDSGMDTGRSIVQAAHPIDRCRSATENRHRVFLMQYYLVLQFFKWIYEERLSIDARGRVTVTNVKYEASIFSPNLDTDFFEFASIDNELS